LRDQSCLADLLLRHVIASVDSAPYLNAKTAYNGLFEG
jgi:hypothetical protein